MLPQIQKVASVMLIVVFAFSPFVTIAQSDNRANNDNDFLSVPGLPFESFSIEDLTEEERAELEQLRVAAPAPELDPSGVQGAEIVSCSDYFSMGNIKVDLRTNFRSYEAGDPVMISGEIRNENRYPVTDLTIRARLVKNIPNPSSSRSEIMILEEFDVLDKVSIDANSALEISYNHLLPVNAPSGEYQILFFAYTNERFNQSGLSFTNNITPALLLFTVKGTNPEHPYLDLTAISVNGQPHNVMGSMTEHGSDSPVTIRLPLSNPTDKTRNMRVKYDLYTWDSSNPKNLLQSEQKDVTVNADSFNMLEYEVKEPKHSVYYLVVTATPLDSTLHESVSKEMTMANMRFVISGINHPRLDSVGIDAYPLQKGKEATLFTCFHNGSDGTDDTGVRIETVVKNQSGKVLAQHSYQGTITQGIGAIATKFMPRAPLSSLTIVSRVLAADGSEIDSVTVAYACEDINPDLCVSEGGVKWLPLLALFVFLVMVTVLIRRWRMRTESFSI